MLGDRLLEEEKLTKQVSQEAILSLFKFHCRFFHETQKEKFKYVRACEKYFNANNLAEKFPDFFSKFRKKSFTNTDECEIDKISKKLRNGLW